MVHRDSRFLGSKHFTQRFKVALSAGSYLTYGQRNFSKIYLLWSFSNNNKNNSFPENNSSFFLSQLAQIVDD